MIRQASLEEIYSICQHIPELGQQDSFEAMRTRVGNRFLGLVYEADMKTVGFKLGYPINEFEFYSWIGGVLPGYRRRNIANQLLIEQERKVAEAGYRLLRVKSMNQFPAMMILLIKSGYAIDNVTTGIKTDLNKIHFFKCLN